MSGLDGLGWPNPKDEPKPKKTMNSQLEIKLAPTPETDAMEYCDAMCDPDRVVEADFARKLERERDEWKAKYIQQNKDLGCEMMDPNGTIWDYAKKVQRELTVVTKQRDQLEGRLRVELGGHPDSELWGDAGLIAATMRCVDALDTVTEQRDRLAAALIKCREDSVCEQVRMEKCRYTKAADESQANIDRAVQLGRYYIDRADKALQSLNQPND